MIEFKRAHWASFTVCVCVCVHKFVFKWRVGAFHTQMWNSSVFSFHKFVCTKQKLPQSTECQRPCSVGDYNNIQQWSNVHCRHK